MAYPSIEEIILEVLERRWDEMTDKERENVMNIYPQVFNGRSYAQEKKCEFAKILAKVVK